MHLRSEKPRRRTHVPVFAYRTVFLLLKLFPNRYREDCLYDLRWGFRRQWNYRKRLGRANQRQACDAWFFQQCISTVLFNCSIWFGRLLLVFKQSR